MGFRRHASPTPRGQRGFALVIALFLMAALSALAVSLTFLSQTETYSTMNYSLMSQARYAGESGVQKTVNYFLNAYVAVMPGSAGDPTTSYDMTKSPVTCTSGCTTTTGTCAISAAGVPSGPCVVLSSLTGVSSNYPIAATATAFNTAATGTLVTGPTTIGYSAYAVLMSMQTVGSSVVQTWAITSDGAVSGARSATVEVTSTLETPVIGVAGNSYAAFASGAACGAITLAGSTVTNSYDSTSALVGGVPAISASNGNIGTNGNLTESGTATINGKLYTPRQGVGTCNNGGGGIAGDALSQSGSATVTGGVVQLPSTWTPPNPPVPNPVPPTTTQTFVHGTGCGSIGSCSYTNGAANPNLMHFNGGTSMATATLLGDIQLTHDVVMHVGAASGCPCYYSMNSFTMAGASQLVIDGGPIIFNITGAPSSMLTTTSVPAVDLSGGAESNATFAAMNLQINYAGARPVTVQGGSSISAVINAPNSPVSLLNGGNFYGSILSGTLLHSGGTSLHYDRRLSSLSSSQSAGVPLLTAFTWKKS
jgi:Tfp pilus assembly protein PilX